MRYKDWDVLLFPGESIIPRQEFKVQCSLAQDDEFSTSGTVSGIPTMTCFTPSLEAGTPFQVSIHSWAAQPEISQSTKDSSQQPDDTQFEARVFIDGHLVASTIMDKSTSWPCLIRSDSSVETATDSDTMCFPAFLPEVLKHVVWSAADSLGRIKVVISEGFPGNFDGAPLKRVKNVVAFSYQHAPSTILEDSGLSWPSPSLWLKTPAPPSKTASKRGSNASTRHSHSPSRPIRKARALPKARSSNRKPLRNGNGKLNGNGKQNGNGTQNGNGKGNGNEKRNGILQPQQGSPQSLMPPNHTAEATPSQIQDLLCPITAGVQPQPGHVLSQLEGAEPSGQATNTVKELASMQDMNMPGQINWAEDDFAWLSAIPLTLQPTQPHIADGENLLLDKLPGAPASTSTPSRSASSSTSAHAWKGGNRGIHRINGAAAAPSPLQFVGNQDHFLPTPMPVHSNIPPVSSFGQGVTFQGQSREFALDPMDTDPFGVSPQPTSGHIPMWSGSSGNRQNPCIGPTATAHQGHRFNHMGNVSRSRPSVASSTNGYALFDPYGNFAARYPSAQPVQSLALAHESSSSNGAWSADLGELGQS